MSDLEDGGVGVGVDGDDLARLVHPSPMLHSARYASRDIQPGPHGGPSLPHLVLLWDIPGINGRSRGAHLTPQQIGQVVDEPKTLLTAYACTPGHNHRRALEVHGRLTRLPTEHLECQVCLVKGRCYPLDDPRAGAVRILPPHHPFAHGGHLRVHGGVDDGSDHVAAEGGPYLVQQALIRLLVLPGDVIANLQVGAIGSQPSPHRAGHPRRQVTAHGSGTIKEDVRLTLLDQSCHHLGVWQGAVVLQLGMVSPQHHVSTVMDGHLCQRLNLMTTQHAVHPAAQYVRQLLCLGQQFQADVGNLPIGLLDKNPNIPVVCHLHPTPQCTPAPTPG